MAVITSAAIAGTAITASTIAAGTAVAATAATTTMSFIDAGKQKKAKLAAENDAAEAMELARKQLEVNVFDKLSLNKDIYEQQRDRFSADAAAAIQAGVESERGAPATAGRVLLASNQVQEGITSAMNQDLQQLEMLSAQEEGRLRDIGVQLSLEEVAGAQLAAANAQELQAQAKRQGMEGIQSIGKQLDKQIPTFDKTASARQSLKLSDTLTQDFGQSQTGVQQNIANQGIIDGVDFSKVATMKPDAFKQFMSSVPAETLRKIRQNIPNTVQSFNPNPLPQNPIGFNLFPVTPFAGR